MIANKCLDLIRSGSVDINATHIFKRLREEGVLARGGSLIEISETTVRNVLREVLHIEGKAGRPRTKDE